MNDALVPAPPSFFPPVIAMNLVIHRFHTAFRGYHALALLLAAAAATPAFANEPGAEVSLPESIQFNRDVRPILTDHCFHCHGPDSASRKADLRLDDPEVATQMNAVVPGDLEASEMITRIRLPETDDLAMPPNTGHKRLTETQRQILERWVAQGAKYEAHWSFIPPHRADVPAVSQSQWVRNPIDAFILEKLEAKGLKPAEEADRRTLARRLALDLTGLPPDPEAVEAFVNDMSPEYYERYVDQLLKSDRYGEHRGRHWLDYARYGDTHGIHFDNFREMWAYRDWVIDAFNRNLPFDQFTVEQLAGDMLPEATLEQKIGSGFNRCNITTNEGGIIDEEYKVLYARDRTETTSTVWMGLTVGCAVCHDHKFDPVSMKDFYALSAFFNNTTQAVRDGNIADTPPIVPVPKPEDRQRFDELAGLIAAAKAKTDAARAEALQTLETNPATVDAFQVVNAMPADKLVLHAFLNEGQGAVVNAFAGDRLRQFVQKADLKWESGHTSPSALSIPGGVSIELGQVATELEFNQSFAYGAWVYPTKDNSGGAIMAKMHKDQDYRGFDLWLENNRVGAHLIHKWPDDTVKVVTKEPLKKNQWQHVFVTYDGSGTDKGVKIYLNGQLKSDVNASHVKLTGTIKNDVPFTIGSRASGEHADAIRVNDLRVYNRMLNGAEVTEIMESSRVAYVVQRDPAKRSKEEKDDLVSYWLKRFSPVYQEALAALSGLEAEDKAIRQRGTIAHVMNERKEAPEAFILERGEYDRQRDKVGAEVPAALPPMAEDLPRNRLGLAKWLTSPAHPLTARVTVNRFWQEVFGTGLVATSGDFGVTGELPSHPQLLDWLAIEFRETGWDVKRLLRLMVTSATYRQAAIATPEKLTLDPQNRLLSRGPRFRMDAEMIRDYVLAVSGLLSPKIGGASVKPYQPEGVWEAVAMTPSNTRIYKQDSGESLYRRSMYTFWKRSAPPASMDIFNAPSREVCTVRRERTNTPLQALAALNDPQLIEGARQLASNAMKQSSEAATRLDWMARRVLARPLVAAEQQILKESLDQLLTHYQQLPEDANKLIHVGEVPPAADLPAGELAAYTMLANQLLNVDEVINK